MNTNTSSGFRSLASQALTSAATAQQLVWTNSSTPALANGANLVLTADQDTPTNGSFDSQVFRVRLVGKAFVGTTGATVTIGVYLGSVTTGTLLKTVVSQSLTSLNTNFFLDTTLIWDSVSQTLTGSGSGVAGSGTAASGTVSNAPLAVATAASLSFVAAATTSAAGAGNTVTVTEFSIEKV